MDAAARAMQNPSTGETTLSVTFPVSDKALFERVINGMGWTIEPQTESDEALRRKRAEDFARKLAFTEEEFQDLKAHDFYLHEMPEQGPVFDVAEDEVAYLDSLDKEGYLDAETSEKYLDRWRNI